MNKSVRIVVSLVVVLAPLFVFAATNKDLNYLIGIVAKYLNSALLLLMGVAVVMFVFYIIRYFIQPSETKRAEGAKYLGWSILGFFIILSFWGIVNVLLNTFALDRKPSTWSDYFSIFPSTTGTYSYPANNPGTASYPANNPGVK